MWYNILFILTVFISAISFRIPGVNYWDEAVVPILFFLAIKKLEVPSIQLLKQQLKKYALLIILVLIGLLGNIVHFGIQPSFVAIVKDVISILKFPLAIFLLNFPRPIENQRKITHKAAYISKIIIIITSLIALIGYFVNIGVYTSEVRMVKCFTFVFRHPTFFVFSYIITLAVLMADSIEKNKWYIIANCLLLFMAQRSKGYLIILVAVIVVIVGTERIRTLCKNFTGDSKIKYRYLVVGIVILSLLVAVVSKSKIEENVKYGLTAARPALYITGFKIALDMFPLGSGFGTFASTLSGEYYSNIYKMYGISNVYGLTPEKYNYMADVFWPYIYGQFGFFGLVAYIALLFKIFKRQIIRLEDYNKIIAYITLWIYMIFASSAETFFTNETALQAVLLLNIFIGVDKEKELKETS